jgi:hypothetical protein
MGKDGAAQGIPPEAYRWKKGESGNPKGMPKGTKHISTWIQMMLTDETFSFESKDKKIKYKGAPMRAIIGVAIYQALIGDKDAREWLAKHGYGLKVNLEVDDPAVAALKRLGLLPDGEDEESEEYAGQTARPAGKTS